MPQDPASNAPIAISMGDPAGIGPEIIVKAWQARKRLSLPPFVVYGAANFFADTFQSIPFITVADPKVAAQEFYEALPIIDIPVSAPVTLGSPNPQNAGAILSSIQAATLACLSHECAALVTAPIHKASLYASGFNFQGHTDYLAHLCGQKNNDVLMMLGFEDLRVVPLTIHIPISAVPAAITQPRLIKAANILKQSLEQRFGFQNPRIGVAALNPHAGEDNTIGSEESQIIAPAIQKLRTTGVNIEGPYPADTLFSESYRGRFDAMIAMYHDQALIPIKTLDFRKAVNTTLGLPVVRTSPDHGTAFDIAGQSIADPESFIQAIFMADRLSKTTHV